MSKGGGKCNRTCVDGIRQISVPAWQFAANVNLSGHACEKHDIGKEVTQKHI